MQSSTSYAVVGIGIAIEKGKNRFQGVAPPKALDRRKLHINLSYYSNIAALHR